MRSTKVHKTRMFALMIVGVLALGVVTAQPAQSQTNFKVLHTFHGAGSADGSIPHGTLVRDAAGNLYGTTYEGGDSSCAYGLGCGTVFEVRSTGAEQVLYSFSGGTNGAFPIASVMRDSAGNLYGTTTTGGVLSGCNDGNFGCGMVFKVASPNDETALYTFSSFIDGSTPEGGLVRDGAGNLYGTTYDGGSSGLGTMFKLNTAGVKAVLHTFIGGADGAYPQGGLVRDAAGSFYGTTVGGGPLGSGTVFRLDSTRNVTVLYSFTGGTDGGSPAGGLVSDRAGNLYGTTVAGGTFARGTVFKVDSTGKETVLHSFAGGADGYGPAAGLLRDAAGNLYGTTAYGGASNDGIVFKVDASGNESVIYSFTGGTDGAHPEAGLVRDAAGNLYGTASTGGYLSCNSPYGCGTVFELTH